MNEFTCVVRLRKDRVEPFFQWLVDYFGGKAPNEMSVSVTNAENVEFTSNEFADMMKRVMKDEGAVTVVVLAPENSSVN